VFQFTTAPVVMDDRLVVWQMGYEWVGGIRPHIRFATLFAPRTDATLGVYAPAGGTVLDVTPVPPDGVRIEILAGPKYRYYLTGLESAAVAPGHTVLAGDRIGERTWALKGGLGQIGLGVINPRLTLFANPLRYPDEIRYADDPLLYFAEPLRSTLRSQINPASAESTLSFDVPGRLQGLWYLPSVPFGNSAAREHRNGWLWFYYTHYPPASGRTLRVAFNDPAMGSLAASLDPSPGPDQVSASTGLVRYRVWPYGGGGAGIFLLVQLLDAQSLRFEAFDAYYAPDPREFTDKARIYIR
jgi:hypothetical protein